MEVPYPHQEFGSIDELTSLISSDTKGWDTRWYRGVKNPAYPLSPKLFRDASVAKREGYIAVEFRRRARPHLQGIGTPFEWLCALQHYGFPTRMLDWSESLAMALYFTVRPAGVDIVAPTVWVLDPFELHTFAGRKSRSPMIPIATDIEVIANADIAFGDDPDRTEKNTSRHPIPVVPDFIFSRLAAQNGAFTIHGTDALPLDQVVPESKRGMLLKYVAKRDRIRAIVDSLDLIIPSADAVFPDVEGIRDYII